MKKQRSQSANLRGQITRARQEHRWKDAVDLAQQLLVAELTEDNRELLRKTTLGCARYLGGRSGPGNLADELPHLLAVFPDDPAWALALAEVAGTVGLFDRALKLLPADATDEQVGKLRGIVADSSIRRHPAGKESLPSEFQADHDRVVQAFELVENGQDDEARTRLQGIALRSPFAEWRLFLRGLMAYYRDDRARALESWGKLAADRLPFLLAAPYRQSIDPFFRDAQTQQLQTLLLQQFGELQNVDPLVTALSRLQQGIAEQRSLGREFAELRSHRAALDALPPDILERLSRSIYWSLMPAHAEERRRFTQIFQVPREDPDFRRLEAIRLERQGATYDALVQWREYENQVAGNTALWGADSDRVRALLWLHMGQLASNPPDSSGDLEDAIQDLLEGGRRNPPAPPIDFTECYQRARELAPDLVRAWIAPVQELVEREDYTRARPLAADLRLRFPDSVDAQMTAAMVFSDLDDLPTALACAEQAARLNPLDKRVRDIRRDFALSLVNHHLRAGRISLAREAVATARLLCESATDRDTLRIQEATVDLKDGKHDAITQVREELAPRMDRVALLYALVIQANSARIDRKTKAPLDREFNELLAGELTLAEALLLARLVVEQSRLGAAPYYGFKTHRDKVTRKLSGFVRAPQMTVREYLDLGLLYHELGAKRTLAQLTQSPPKNIPAAAAYYLRFVQTTRERLFEMSLLFQQAERGLHEIADPKDRAYLLQLIEEDKTRDPDLRNPFDIFASGPPDPDEGTDR